MKQEMLEMKIQAEIARQEYRNGIITRQEAKERIMPYINSVNEKSKELADKYNQKYKAVTFSNYIR